MLPLEPLDTLEDVFAPAELDLAALLRRYRGYLARLAAEGQDPWKGQPRRQDLNLSEAVGHFHLYAWLRDALLVPSRDEGVLSALSGEEVIAGIRVTTVAIGWG